MLLLCNCLSSLTHLNCACWCRDYTHWMNGVDVGDQKRSYYDARIKSHQWHMHYFYCILDTSICNAHLA